MNLILLFFLAIALVVVGATLTFRAYRQQVTVEAIAIHAPAGIRPLAVKPFAGDAGRSRLSDGYARQASTQRTALGTGC